MPKIAQEPAPKLERSDVVLALMVLASILAVALIFIFAQGETAMSLSVVLGWLIEIAIWVYIFAFAI